MSVCYYAKTFETFEVRSDPDALPCGNFINLDDAIRFAYKRAERTGRGPYLLYGLCMERGEVYLGEVG